MTSNWKENNKGNWRGWILFDKCDYQKENEYINNTSYTAWIRSWFYL